MKTIKTVEKKKEQDNKIHIEVDYSKIPNKLHFETQLNTRAHIFEDKRKKKPKYKEKYED